MKEETKNEVKKNVATGASTAAGATVGVGIGAALSPEQAHAQETPTPEPTPQPTPGPKHTPAPEHEPTTPEPTEPEPTEPKPTDNMDVDPVDPTEPETPGDNEVEVIGYDRVTNEDGSQMDIAVLNVNGNEVGVVDMDLDGEADVILCDANHNGIIEEDEMQIVHGEGIDMQPLANAAGFNPLYAQNDLPDYVNDADVDTYMA